MNRWSRHFSKCQSCGTIRFPHAGGGCCTRCYRLIRQLDVIERWDLHDPKTLKGYPRDTSFWRPDTLEFVRARRRHSIQMHLLHLKTREEQLAGQADGLDLEYAFNRIAKRCGSRKPNLFHGLSTFFDHNFDVKRKNILFRLVNDIEESSGWEDSSRESFDRESTAAQPGDQANSERVRSR